MTRFMVQGVVAFGALQLITVLPFPDHHAGCQRRLPNGNIELYRCDARKALQPKHKRKKILVVPTGRETAI